jgi:hypothetical protein
MARAGTTRVTGLNENLNLTSPDNPVSIPLLSVDASAGRIFTLNLTPFASSTLPSVPKDSRHFNEAQKVSFSKTQLVEC